MTTILNTNTLIQNTYTEANFRTSIVGTSDCNEFIPVYAIANHKLLVFKDLDSLVNLSISLCNISLSLLDTFLFSNKDFISSAFFL